MANLNDTDGDGVQDNNDSDVSVEGANPPGRNEIDLMKLVVTRPVPDDGGSVTLRVVSGHVKLWKHSTKKEEFPMSGGATSIATEELPMTLWVEARSGSFAMRDIEIELEYKGCTDKVKATAVWVTASRVWHTRQSQDGFPNNPVPGPGNDLPDLEDGGVLQIISDDQSVDNSRYGHGSIREENGEDSAFGGRILWEFKARPHYGEVNGVPGLESLGVKFDITRQLFSRIFAIMDGDGHFDPALTTAQNFPWEEQPPLDNELPNDDDNSGDEQNVPKNDHIYVWDAPQTGISAFGRAFEIKRFYFKEWVRMQIGTDFPPAPPNHEQVHGSRCSPKYDWFSLVYIRRGEDDELVEDVDNPSASEPRGIANGNGSMKVIELLADADTEGFTAEYDEADLKWTVTGTSSDSGSDQVQSAPEGAKWVVTVANKVKVEITQGAWPFETGDRFMFSIFKSTAQNGKQNNMGTGIIDPTDGP